VERWANKVGGARSSDGRGESTHHRGSLPLVPRPFPAEEIRDALGAVRLLYAARLATGRAKPGQPDPLIEIGHQLRSALSYARAPNDSSEQRGAIACAAAALGHLAEVVTLDDSLTGAVRAGAARVRGAALRSRARVSAPDSRD
jgi:hypothetical protein